MYKRFFSTFSVIAFVSVISILLFIDFMPQSHANEIGAIQFIEPAISSDKKRQQFSAPQNPPAEQLIAELGCGSCHTGLQIPSREKDKIPNLAYAGFRYNPAYLLDFLQTPVNIRRHIGAARMPNFQFSESEALALARFLETRKEIPDKLLDLPPEIQSATNENQSFEHEKPAANIRDKMICLTCHSLNGAGGTMAVDLSSVEYRLRPEWVRPFLAFPLLFGIPGRRDARAILSIIC